MTSLCWRTLKIIRFAERHSVFCKICWRTLRLLKYSFLTLEEREEWRNVIFAPAFFFPLPFLLSPAQVARQQPLQFLRPWWRIGQEHPATAARRSSARAVLRRAGRTGGGRAQDARVEARAEARPWQTAEARAARGRAGRG